MIMESNLTGEGGQPTESEVSGVVRRLRNGATWQEVFPGVASLNLDSQGHGLDVSIRLTRSSGAPPVRIVREGESGAEDATIVREVDSLDRYSMGPKLLASHLDLTVPKTGALIHHLDLTAQPDCYKRNKYREDCLQEVFIRGIDPTARGEGQRGYGSRLAGISWQVANFPV